MVNAYSITVLTLSTIIDLAVWYQVGLPFGQLAPFPPSFTPNIWFVGSG